MTVNLEPRKGVNTSMNTLRQKLTTGKVAAGAGLVALAAPAVSFAAPSGTDYSSVQTSILDEIGAFMPILLGVVGVLIAIRLGVSWFRKNAK